MTEKKRVLKVHTPGVIPASPEPKQEEVEDVAPEDLAPEEVAAEPKEKPAPVGQKMPKGKQLPESELPDQADIDVSTLKRPVLTRQGWLCPPEIGRPPAR